MMNQNLGNYIGKAILKGSEIASERSGLLKELSEYVNSKIKNNEVAKITFICTHNSRRSHFGQIWAAIAANYYGLDKYVNTFSGGTEVTAFNQSAIAAIERTGIEVEKPAGKNPHYKLIIPAIKPEIICFSKLYNDSVNPSESFAAILTCSDADENCPFIPGADFRLPLPYVDPKISDGTDKMIETYDERCLEIASEMFYVFNQVTNNPIKR